MDFLVERMEWRECMEGVRCIEVREGGITGEDI
jgi:hypothetical protein